MRTYTTKTRRTEPRVESLEGKTLLSTGSLMHRAVHRVTGAPIVVQATAGFSGTLTGDYSNAHAPGFANIVSFATSGTLSGIGLTRLKGTLFASGRPQVGRLIGEFRMGNRGGAMTVNVFRSTMRGIYTYEVVRARGSDTTYIGSSGRLEITRTPTFDVPFVVFGQATMTFTS
jgi:hypothetical protein